MCVHVCGYERESMCVCVVVVGCLTCVGACGGQRLMPRMSSLIASPHWFFSESAHRPAACGFGCHTRLLCWVRDLNSGPHASTLPTKPPPQPLVLFLSDFTEVEFICHKSHLFLVYCLVNFVNRLSHEAPPNLL